MSIWLSIKIILLRVFFGSYTYKESLGAYFEFEIVTKLLGKIFVNTDQK